MLVKASLGCAALVLGFLGGAQAYQLAASPDDPAPTDRAIDPAARADEVGFEECLPQASAPPYPVNDTGMTYGSGAGIDEDDPGPDLIAAYGTNGRCGYIRAADRTGGTEERDIPLYERDGVTVIGVFHIGRGRTLTSRAPQP